MKLLNRLAGRTSSCILHGRSRPGARMTHGTALFVADWIDAIFIHFAVNAARLQRTVPLELDRWDGEAIVSLVAFTQRNLRPRVGGRLTELLAAPLAGHEFLNVRTYVRHGRSRGIFFM